MQLGPGTYNFESLVLDDEGGPNNGAFLTGAGPGVTRVLVHGGIKAYSRDLYIANLDIIGDANGVRSGAIGVDRISLGDTSVPVRDIPRYTITADNVRIWGFTTQFRNLGQFASINWLNNFRNCHFYDTEGGGDRLYDPNVTGFIGMYDSPKTAVPVYDGNGELLYYKYGWPSGGGFINTHTFDTCRFAVGGAPFVIRGLTATKMTNCYADISYPIIFGAEAHGLYTSFSDFDLNSQAKTNNRPVMVLENPDFAELIHIGVRQGWKDPGSIALNRTIVDAQGNPTDKFTLAPSALY